MFEFSIQEPLREAIAGVVDPDRLLLVIDSPDDELAGPETENRLVPVVAGEIELASVAAARALEAPQPEREVNSHRRFVDVGDSAVCFSTVGDIGCYMRKKEEEEGE